MYPILFSVGDVPIYSYGVFILLGTIVLFAIVYVLARGNGHTREQIMPIMIGSFVGAFVVARLSQAFLEPDQAERYLDFYGLLRPAIPGNVVGLMIGGYLGGLMMQRSLRLPSIGNYYALALACGHAIWRVGCTLAGCCYGKPTNLPWAIYEDDAYRHPTMIYDGLFNLAMIAVLWRLRNRITRADELLFCYFGAYAFFRFWLEYIRVYPVVALGLTGAQWLCLASLVVLGGYVLFRDTKPLVRGSAA